MTVQTALQQGTKLLEESNVVAPRLTAEVLLSHALRKERVFLYSHPEHELSQVAWLHYGRYLFQRGKGMPTQYITKRQEFYGRDFHVTPAVLIPRPETELVVETALRLAQPGDRIMDVGCGSGAIAITLSLEAGRPVVASDISPDALAVARRNGASLGANVQFIQGNLLEAFADDSLDLIVSNPPYVPLADRPGLQREVRDYEPSVALFGGPKGNEIYDRLVEDAVRVLRPCGRLVMELGFKSLDAVTEMFSSKHWGDVQTADDLAGIPRVISARLVS